MIVSKRVGVKLIREYGLHSFTDDGFEYHTLGGGIFAVKDCKLGGKEIHLAFKEEFRYGAVNFIVKFCDSLKADVWALIEDEYNNTINAAFKCGFRYKSLEKGRRLNGTIANIHVMKRTLK